MLVVLMVCAVGPTCAMIVSRYRNGDATAGRAIRDALGVLHTVERNRKEARQSTIWEELPATYKRVWITFLFFIPLIASIIIFLTPPVPVEWRVEGMEIILPLLWTATGHVLFPFLLNPFVVLLSY